MKKYIKEILSIMFFIAIIWFLTNVSNAASISLTPSKATAEAGENVNVTVSSDCVGRVNLTVSNGKISTNKVWIEGGTQTVTVTVGNSGTTSITASAQDNMLSNNGVDVPVSAITKSISIKSATISNNNGKSSDISNSDTQKTQTKSNVATLSNLGIKGQYDFTGFTSSKTSYSVTVPNDVESVEIYASKGQNGQKISGTGVKQLQEGVNAVNVVVTAEDGKTTKTYTVNIERKALEENTEEQTEETQESTTFGLKDLKVEGMELTPEFNTDTYSYTVQLTEDKSSLGLTTIATDEKASIEVNGNEDLKDGENIITIIVKDETGEKTVTYQITVNKTVSNNEKTEATVQNINNSKKKKILILVCGVIFIILIIVIIMVIKKKKDSNNGDYYQSNIEIQDNNTSELKYEEPKKKHSKGKRFK
ncbi:MAG: cadherin-like beta sandwich domain-containing protein [Clostridia bacterium]